MSESTPAAHAPETAAPHAHGGGAVPIHVAPLWVLGVVFAALMILTVVTVLAIRVDLGALNIWIAMLIAAAKGALVALYFMHLRYDKPLNALVFIASLLFVAFFIGFALMDTAEYQPAMIENYEPGMPR